MWVKCSERQPTEPGEYKVRYGEEDNSPDTRTWDGTQWLIIDTRAQFNDVDGLWESGTPPKSNDPRVQGRMPGRDVGPFKVLFSEEC